MQALEQAIEPYDTIEWPKLELQTNWKISFTVFSAHLLALWLIAFGAHMTTPKKVPKKLIVHTVTLQSKPTTVVTVPKPGTKSAPAAKKAEKPALAAAAKTAPEKASEPIITPAAEVEKPVEAPKVIEEEEPAAPPEPEPREPAKAPQKAESKPAAKTPSKPVAKPQAKPKQPSKPVATKPQTQKKEAPKAKTTQPTKSEKPKTDKVKQDKQKQEKQKQEQAAKDAKAKEQANKERIAQERAAKDKAAKAQAAKQQAMLDKALSSLDSSGAIAGKKSTLAASAAAGAVAGPSAITSLSAESLVAIDASETANCTPAERTYYDELVSRLKLSLKLPEFGEVKLQLTINRSGKVVTVKSVKSKSKKNSDYIQKALPKLHLPSFGQNFAGEKEHTFRLTLSNELTY